MTDEIKTFLVSAARALDAYTASVTGGAVPVAAAPAERKPRKEKVAAAPAPAGEAAPAPAAPAAAVLPTEPETMAACRAFLAHFANGTDDTAGRTKCQAWLASQKYPTSVKALQPEQRAPFIAWMAAEIKAAPKAPAAVA